MSKGKTDYRWMVYYYSLVEWTACTDSLLRSPKLTIFFVYILLYYYIYIYLLATPTLLYTRSVSSSCPYKLNEMCSLFPHLRRRLARIVPRSRGTISYSFIWSSFPSLVINKSKIYINLRKLENRHEKRWNKMSTINEINIIFDSQTLWIEYSHETFC